MIFEVNNELGLDVVDLRREIEKKIRKNNLYLLREKSGWSAGKDKIIGIIEDVVERRTGLYINVILNDSIRDKNQLNLEDRVEPYCRGVFEGNGLEIRDLQYLYLKGRGN